MRTVVLIVILFLGIVQVFAQPNPRHLEEVAYDKARKKLILFGGAEFEQGRMVEPSVVFEWDGRKWERFESPGPSGRRGHGWVYDENRKATLLIGGVCEGAVSKDSLLFDVWSWDGIQWKQLNTVCPVKEPETVYDPLQKRILVYGDASNKSVVNYDLKASFELWEYSSGGWKKLSADGPGIISSRMICFDSRRNRLVIPVYDQKQMVVWEWTGNGWERTACENSFPAYRTRFTLAYDPAENASLLFGGLTEERTQLGDFWKWNGKKWEQVEDNKGPSVRNSAHFVFCRDQLILYGGSVPELPPAKGIKACTEIWSWKNGAWKSIK